MGGATATRPLGLLPRHAAAAIQVLLLLLLPWHSTAAKYHTVIPSMVSTPSSPPAPKTTADDKSMRVWDSLRHRRSLSRNFVSLSLRIGGTDSVLQLRAGNVGVGQ